jgi:hypothetical protein
MMKEMSAMRFWGGSGSGKQEVPFQPPEWEKTVREQTPKGRRSERKEDLGD